MILLACGFKCGLEAVPCGVCVEELRQCAGANHVTPFTVGKEFTTHRETDRDGVSANDASRHTPVQ